MHYLHVCGYLYEKCVDKNKKKRESAVVRVCKVEIQNFRSIRLLTWQPSPGLNCLIGPGDSGKTTILDAIDLCLCATT
ncbi:ATP-binding protein [Klebsiella variicola subsp. variicola]|uniref:ATP-binding protein n=1 Tax=Klebsiella sp. GG_Kp148 TaxID=3153459 RepID=UPI0027E2A630|nr:MULTISPECIES: ATP-binding protein [Klebsiella]